MGPAGADLLMLEVEFLLMLVAPAFSTTADRDGQTVVARHARVVELPAAAGTEEVHRVSFGLQHH
jgi:hypothetical protein